MSELAPGVLAAGSWIYDTVKIVNRYPKIQTLSIVKERHDGTGGAPYNVLVNLSRLGAKYPLHAAGCIGSDAQGRHILRTCKKHRIDVSQLKVSIGTTARTDVISEEEGGARTFFHEKGTNAMWDGSGLDFRRSGCSHFHLGYLLLLDRLDRLDATGSATGASQLLQRAKESGLTTSIDAVTCPHDKYGNVLGASLRYVDYCIIADDELAMATKLRVRGGNLALRLDLVRVAIGRLQQEYGASTVIVHFPEGAVCGAGDEFIEQPSLDMPKSDIKGTAGAGDAFAAGFLHGILTNLGQQESMRLGTLVAAACLRHPTCTGGITDLKACLAQEQMYDYRDLSPYY
jgi:sugar/nucleoside kinase (ribokinase family)